MACCVVHGMPHGHAAIEKMVRCNGKLRCILHFFAWNGASIVGVVVIAILLAAVAAAAAGVSSSRSQQPAAVNPFLLLEPVFELRLFVRAGDAWAGRSIGCGAWYAGGGRAA